MRNLHSLSCSKLFATMVAAAVATTMFASPAVAGMSGAAPRLNVEPSTSSSSGPYSFATPGLYTVTVPKGVGEATISATGGGGGSAGDFPSCDQPGKGGLESASFPVKSGATLDVTVAGKGGAGATERRSRAPLPEVVEREVLAAVEQAVTPSLAPIMGPTSTLAAAGVAAAEHRASR